MMLPAYLSAYSKNETSKYDGKQQQIERLQEELQGVLRANELLQPKLVNFEFHRFKDSVADMIYTGGGGGIHI